MFCISRKEQNLDPKQESIPPPAHIEVGNEKTFWRTDLSLTQQMQLHCKNEESISSIDFYF